KMKLAFGPEPVQSIFGKASGLTGVTPMLEAVAGRLTHPLCKPAGSHRYTAALIGDFANPPPQGTASSVRIGSMEVGARRKHLFAGSLQMPAYPVSKWSNTLGDPLRPLNTAVQPPPSVFMSQNARYSVPSGAVSQYVPLRWTPVAASSALQLGRALGGVLNTTAPVPGAPGMPWGPCGPVAPGAPATPC